MISEAVKIEWNCRKSQFHLVSTPRQGEVTLLAVPAKQSNQSLPHGEVTPTQWSEKIVTLDSLHREVTLSNRMFLEWDLSSALCREVTLFVSCRHSMRRS